MPSWFGAIISIGVQLLFFVSFAHLTSLTRTNISNIMPFLNETTTRKAWIETKRQYVAEKGAFSRNLLRTYRSTWVERFYLNNLIASLQGRKISMPPTKTDPLNDEIQLAGADL